MNKRLIEMCDELLRDWTEGKDNKSNRAWQRLLKDCKVKNG